MAAGHRDSFTVPKTDEDGEAHFVKDGKAKIKTQTTTSGLKAFEKVMPVPIQYPGKKYGNDDKPWFYTE